MSVVLQLADRVPRSNGSATTAGGKVSPVLEELTAQSATLLERRGLNPELAAKYGLRTRRGDHGGAEHDWVGIPTIRNGKTVGVQLRRILKKDGYSTFFQVKESKQVFWNHDCLLDESLREETLIITEGVFDALAVIGCNFPRTLSVPGGAPISEIKELNGDTYKYAYEILEKIEGCTDILLLVDADEQGGHLRNALAKILGRPRCRYVTWPPGCKDANDVVRELGQKALTDIILDAKLMPLPGLVRMSELPDQVEHPALPPKIPGFDVHFRIRRTDLSVITGWPGMGKTTMLNAISASMVKNYGWKVCYASFEQATKTDGRRWFRTWHSGFAKDAQTPEMTRAADDWVDENYTFIDPAVGGEFDIADLMDAWVGARMRYGCDLFVWDPWNSINHKRADRETETEYVRRALKMIKEFAIKFETHVMLAVHPSKGDAATRLARRPPHLQDIAGSSHFYNKCDLGAVVHRIEDKTRGVYTLFDVQKSRYQDTIGKVGRVELTYHGKTCRFQEAAP